MLYLRLQEPEDWLFFTTFQDLGGNHSENRAIHYYRKGVRARTHSKFYVVSARHKSRDLTYDLTRDPVRSYVEKLLFILWIIRDLASDSQR